MTTARHRFAVAAARPPAGPTLRGKAPGGMWWMAWRQHRLQIGVVLALIAALIGALVLLRSVAVAHFVAAGRDLTGPCVDVASRTDDPWFDDGLWYWSSLLHSGLTIVPIVLGVFAGAPIFAREFSRGTHVFALTQAVSRRRWWTVKVAVAGLPLLAGLVVLGMVSEWADDSVPCTAGRGLAVDRFIVQSIIPAAHGLIAFTVAVAAGILTRSTVTSLVSGLIAAGLIVGGLAIAQPHLLPTTRLAITLEQQAAGVSPPDGGPDASATGGGYLDGDGNPISADPYSCYDGATAAAEKAVGFTPGDRGDRSSPDYQNAFNRAFLDCAHSRGVYAQYTDYLTSATLWPLRWTVAGIAAILAALFLLLGARRLPIAIARR